MTRDGHDAIATQSSMYSKGRQNHTTKPLHSLATNATDPTHSNSLQCPDQDTKTSYEPPCSTDSLLPNPKATDIHNRETRSDRISAVPEMLTMNQNNEEKKQTTIHSLKIHHHSSPTSPFISSSLDLKNDKMKSTGQRERSQPITLSRPYSTPPIPQPPHLDITREREAYASITAKSYLQPSPHPTSSHCLRTNPTTQQSTT